MQFITRPLEKWPRPATTHRTAASYGVTYTRSLDLLDRELEHLKVTGDVIIQIDMPEGNIRRDGMPYADKQPNSPRVALSFVCKHGPLAYYCDAHHDWRDNIRAIVLGLERLRLVERTGVISRGEQYTGFRALPGGIAVGPARMTVEEAAREMALLGAIPDRWRDMMADIDQFKTLYRSLAARLHPDAGGRPEQWQTLQNAADVLKKHHGIA